jgi:multidrug efflux pump subunit AcrB
MVIIALGLASWFALLRMPRDIFPSLKIPTIYVAQPYGGMDAAQMEGYLTYYYEYHFLYIAGIEHVESKNIQGASIMKLQFHPGTDMSAALSETIAYVNRSRSFMPPGTPGAFVTRFDAGSVPVGNLVFSTENPNRTQAVCKILSGLKRVAGRVQNVITAVHNAFSSERTCVEFSVRSHEGFQRG